jgi:hypothetical protein
MIVVRFPAWAGNFPLRHHVQTGYGAQPASYPMGTGVSFSGVKRPGCEADHSPPSSAEVKNAWSYTSTPQYVFMEWCLVKHRDNFTLPYITLDTITAYRNLVGVSLSLSLSVHRPQV